MCRLGELGFMVQSLGFRVWGVSKVGDWAAVGWKVAGFQQGSGVGVRMAV